MKLFPLGGEKILELIPGPLRSQDLGSMARSPIGNLSQGYVLRPTGQQVQRPHDVEIPGGCPS